MAGTGKRTQLHEALKKVAAIRRVPFSIQTKSLAATTATGDVAEAGATEGGAGPEDAEAGQMSMESSLIHIGLDIARMSMQDKHILRPILAKLGQGSQVMAGQQGRGHRIIVLYHAHLLSSESVLLIQACLEQNEGDLSIWVTSELPIPQRIRDWFVEISVGGEDRNFQLYKATVALASPVNWPAIFTTVINKWLLKGAPRLQEVKEIKALVYDMLMRNLRWAEATHFLLDVILTHPNITAEQRQMGVNALAACEATGGGYTIPSYRIPILWESLFLQLRTIFVKEFVIVDAPVSTGGTSKTSKRRLVKARNPVATL
jgi:hypothetical protein